MLAGAPIPGLAERLDDPDIGEAIYTLAAKLYPICRSIAGDGVRATLGYMREHVALAVHEVASGTPVFDWTVPREWSIRDAWIKNENGDRVVDFGESNLHVLNYSLPVDETMTLDELKPHIFTLPDQPSRVPYRTAYYAPQWGFCMAHEEFLALEPGRYEVLIDAAHSDGHMSYGEYFHSGESEREVLLSAHICHPSLANDNCSGLALLTMLATRLSRLRTRLSYRFVFAPGTIGAIAWLAANRARVDRIAHGLTVSCVGDRGAITYKRSRRGNATIDRAMAQVLAGETARIVDFSPYGYDERQYCSPGFDLPVGSFQRSQWGTFPEYHTSADDLGFIAPGPLAHSYRTLARLIDVLEGDRVMVNLKPYGEPQLGRYGLYSGIGNDPSGRARTMAMLWVLNLSDGRHSLLDIAEHAGIAFDSVRRAAADLERAGLLADAADGRSLT